MAETGPITGRGRRGRGQAPTRRSTRRGRGRGAFAPDDQERVAVLQRNRNTALKVSNSLFTFIYKVSNCLFTFIYRVQNTCTHNASMVQL